jgi:hypothetical protein
MEGFPWMAAARRAYQPEEGQRLAMPDLLHTKGLSPIMFCIGLSTKRICHLALYF